MVAARGCFECYGAPGSPGGTVARLESVPRAVRLPALVGMSPGVGQTLSDKDAGRLSHAVGSRTCGPAPTLAVVVARSSGPRERGLSRDRRDSFEFLMPVPSCA